jgi:phage baseplate assembly protein W
MLAEIAAYLFGSADEDQIPIDWSKKGVARIIQNVINLINTYRYEVAYDRTLGLSGNYLDKPFEQMIAEATTEIYELIEKKEPRVDVKGITFSQTDINGNTQFKVVIDIVGY